MKVGIAFSGGAVRGFCHLGILKALHEMGVQPTLFSGASAGAIVGAMSAAGHTPEAIFDYIEGSPYLSSLRPSFGGLGMLQLKSVATIFGQYLPKNFEGLKYEFTLNATDLLNGEVVYFNSGELIQPLLASCAIPGVFEPVRVGDRLLVDGGVLNNLPIEPLEDRCDILIACHCNPVGPVAQPLKSMRAVMERSFYLASTKAIQPKISQCSVFIEPPEMQYFKVYDRSKARDMFRAGYHHTKKLQGQIEKVIAG